MLTDDGVMLLHTIGRIGTPGTTDAFTRKYIFPGGYIPALSETVAASEKYRLIASDVEMLRLHYARTLRAGGNCEANRERIEAMFDARFYRMDLLSRRSHGGFRTWRHVQLPDSVLPGSAGFLDARIWARRKGVAGR